MTDEQKSALSVSSPHGYISTREYINTLRAIFGDPELTQEQYDDGIRICEKLGRQHVITLHRLAIDQIAQQFPPAP